MDLRARFLSPENKTLGKWLPGVTEEDYQGGPGLGYSGIQAYKLSALNFKENYLENRKDTRAKSFGSLVHSVLLEPEKTIPRIKVAPSLDMRTRVGKEAMANFLDSLPESSLVVEQDELDKIHRMRDSIARHKTAWALVTAGESEVSTYFQHQNSGVILRARADKLFRETAIMADLKTTRSCSKWAFSDSFAKYGYYIQDALYREAFYKIEARELQRFIFIAVENESPYDVALFESDIHARDTGRAVIRQVCADVKNSIEHNSWPGKQPGPEPEMISIPHKYSFQEIE